MRKALVRVVAHAAALGGLALGIGCSGHATHARSTARGGHVGEAPNPSSSSGLILRESEGERRVRRLPPTSLSTLTAPVILKVDGRNGGSPDLVMFYEDIPPGQAIAPHHHEHADEILFVHRGTGLALLGDRSDTVTAGATIYIPPKTRISLRNTGTEPLSIVAIFARPGMEGYMRAISVPEGERASPLTVEELSRIRERNREHIVFELP
jgi:quercetin dioxygenase-like cupin family protein